MTTFFYLPQATIGAELPISSDESKHLAKALRKQPGDTVHVTNGIGQLFEAVITTLDKKSCYLLIKTEVSPPTARTPYPIHMVVAPTKNNQRFEWFLEKAAELGIQSVTPIICERSERKQINQERCERILIAGMKQSLSTYKVQLNECIALSDFMHQQTPSNQDTWVMGSCDPKAPLLSTVSINPSNTITCFIGPEGDFTPKEADQFTAVSTQSVSIGPQRFRVETAAILMGYGLVGLLQAQEKTVK